MSVSSRPTSHPRRRALPRRSRPEWIAWATLAALALWALAPIVYLLVKAAAGHESLSGGDSLFPADQLQYLSWIRSEGQHGLAADGFDLRAGNHVFLHPMFLISGLLWRAGVNIALTYLLWVPVAVAALFVGFRRYTQRLLQAPAAQAAALVLALFFVTPAEPFVSWTVGSSGLGTLSGELSPAGLLFGYLPDAIAVGLMPLYMLGLDPIAEPPGLTARRHSRRWYLAWTSATGLIVAWLHPWQGEILLLVTLSVFTLTFAQRRTRRIEWALALPAIATALPLGYYFVLSKIDIAWSVAQVQSAPPLPNPLLLVVALAPLLALAWLGVRGWRAATEELVLVAWPVSALLVYFFSTGFSAHALEGISLPLVVLSVRGWQRLRLGWWSAIAAITVIALSTVPGLIADLRVFRAAVLANPQELLLNQDQTAALGYLAREPAAGGVLPSLNIAAAVPAYTGRRTWLGHLTWTPRYAARAAAATELFDGQLSPVAGRAFLSQVGARYILADCQPGFDPTWLAPLVATERSFGCVTVYELRSAPPAAAL